MANPASSHCGDPPLCCQSPRPISTANFPDDKYIFDKILKFICCNIYLSNVFVQILSPPWWPVQRHLTVGSPPLLPILKANFSGGQFSGGKFWCQSRGSQRRQNWPRDDLSCTTLCMTGGCRQKFRIRKNSRTKLNLKMQLKTYSIWKEKIQMVFFKVLLSKHFLDFASV